MNDLMLDLVDTNSQHLEDRTETRNVFIALVHGCRKLTQREALHLA